MSTYRPLPNSLTIKKSSVDGLGLFAVIEIDYRKVFFFVY